MRRFIHFLFIAMLLAGSFPGATLARPMPISPPSFSHEAMAVGALCFAPLAHGLYVHAPSLSHLLPHPPSNQSIVSLAITFGTVINASLNSHYTARRERRDRIVDAMRAFLRRESAADPSASFSAQELKDRLDIEVGHETIRNYFEFLGNDFEVQHNGPPQPDRVRAKPTNTDAPVSWKENPNDSAYAARRERRDAALEAMRAFLRKKNAENPSLLFSPAEIKDVLGLEVNRQTVNGYFKLLGDDYEIQLGKGGLSPDRVRLRPTPILPIEAAGAKKRRKTIDSRYAKQRERKQEILQQIRAFIIEENTLDASRFFSALELKDQLKIPLTQQTIVEYFQLLGPAFEIQRKDSIPTRVRLKPGQEGERLAVNPELLKLARPFGRLPLELALLIVRRPSFYNRFMKGTQTIRHYAAALGISKDEARTHFRAYLSTGLISEPRMSERGVRSELTPEGRAYLETLRQQLKLPVAEAPPKQGMAKQPVKLPALPPPLKISAPKTDELLFQAKQRVTLEPAKRPMPRLNPARLPQNALLRMDGYSAPLIFRGYAQRPGMPANAFVELTPIDNPAKRVFREAADLSGELLTELTPQEQHQVDNILGTRDGDTLDEDVEPYIVEANAQPSGIAETTELPMPAVDPAHMRKWLITAEIGARTVEVLMDLVALAPATVDAFIDSYLFSDAVTARQSVIDKLNHYLTHVALTNPRARTSA